jgi:flagellar biosynthesis/type III secretory pathway protein FliH
MKSYSKFLPSEFIETLDPWLPEILEKADDLANDPKVAEIMAIFNSFQPEQKTPRISTNQSFIQGGAGCPKASWMPDEITWVPPFNTADHWATWDGDKPGEPLRAAPAIPEAKLPTPEEEKAAILAAAHERAEQILTKAQKSADETLLKAQEEMRRSIDEGYQKGWQASQTEAETVIRAAHEVVSELINWREDMLARSEETVVSMIRDISRFMFGDGVKLDEMGLQMNLSRVLENAKSLGDVRIFLNPGDAIRLDPAWKEYQSMLSGNKIIIVPSEGIKPGGCFVQGETGSIDARVEAQMENALGVFNQTFEV